MQKQVSLISISKGSHAYHKGPPNVGINSGTCTRAYTLSEKPITIKNTYTYDMNQTSQSRFGKI
jgi:hypothetical protein